MNSTVLLSKLLKFVAKKLLEQGNGAASSPPISSTSLEIVSIHGQVLNPADSLGTVLASHPTTAANVQFTVIFW